MSNNLKTDYGLTAKRLFSLAAPLMLANIISAASNFTVMLLMSKLGHQAVAAGALLSSTLGLINMLTIALIMPIGIIVGKHVGANQPHLVGKVVRAGMLLVTLTSIPLILFMFFIGSVLHLFKQPPEVIGLVVAYCHAFVWGVLPSFWNMALGQFCMGIKRPRIIMTVTALTLPFNIIISYALLFGKFGLPNLGIAGAGFAVAGICWIAFLGLLVYFRYMSAFAPFQLFTKFAGTTENYLSSIFSVGWPICLQYGAELSAFTLMTYWMGWLGVVALAAQQISMQWIIVACFMITMAIGQATSVLVGQAYGRQDMHAARVTGYVGILLNFSYMLLVAAVFLFAPRFLTGVYLNVNHPANAAIFKLTAQLLGVSAVTQLFDSIRLACASALRGFLDTQVPMLISIVGCWLIAVPCSYLFAFVLGWGPVGLRWGGGVGIAFAATLLLLRFYKFDPLR